MFIMIIICTITQIFYITFQDSCEGNNEGFKGHNWETMSESGTCAVLSFTRMVCAGALGQVS